MQALRGTQDILPKDIWKWNYVEKKIFLFVILVTVNNIIHP